MAETSDHPGAPVARVDLHCHTRASFDGVADPAALVERAAAAGLTHLAVTDHDTIEGALLAVEAADRQGLPLRVIVGSEVLTREGDLVFAFLRAPLPTGLSAREAIAAGREQGALVGLPHPFDRSRRSVLRDAANLPLAELVDWIEARNGRVPSRAADAEAERLARRLGKPGIGASDAHTLLEVGSVVSVLGGDPTTPEGLLATLRAGVRIERAVGEPAAPARDGSPLAAIRSLARRAHAGRARG